MHTPTKLISEISSGNKNALNQLFELIYEELHSVAKSQRNRWSGHATLDTTALIHETYIKLWRNQPDHLENRLHFLSLAAKAMRQILINYAEKRSAQKRGGDTDHLSANELELIADEQVAVELLDMDGALTRLEKSNERQAKVFEYRFFGGMTVEDTASVLNISPATVKRDWQAACARIYREVRSEK